MTITRLCHQCNEDFSYEVTVIPQSKRNFCDKCLKIRRRIYNIGYRKLKINDIKPILNKKYNMNIVFAYDEVNQLL